MSALRNGGRRAFLRGVGGVTLGLPLLEYTHERAWAAGEGFAKRFIVVFTHGGETSCVYKDGTAGGQPVPDYVMDRLPAIDHWLPKSGSRFGVAHEMFEGTPVEDKMMVVRGLDNGVCTGGRYGGDHTLSNCSALTARETICQHGGSPGGAKCPTEEYDEYSTGPSIDWVAAQRLQKKYGGPATPLGLLVDSNAFSSYGSPFFWGANGEQRVEGESNPKTAFDALFRNVMTGEPDPAAIRRQALKTSMLNGVMEGYTRFAKRLGSRDKQIIDAHFDHLSELEKEIAGVEVSAACVVPGAPASTSDTEQSGPLHAKLIVAAMRCGLTNVANLQIVDMITSWTPAGSPTRSDIGHTLGHWIINKGAADQATWEREMKDNRAWRMGLVKMIADGLDDPAFMEGGKTMLDNSLIYYTSEFGCAGIHSSTDGAHMLVGGAGGYFDTGRYVELHSNRASKGPGSTASTNDLFVSILNALGEPDTTFGDMEYAYRGRAITELR